MTSALLVRDASEDPLPTRIRQAVVSYSQKYGKHPTRCRVNPIHIEEGEIMIGIDLVGDGTIMPGYLWLEVDEA